MYKSGRSVILWLAWVTFVIYGSLIPFDYQPLGFDVALESFRRIPYLKLGLESRADWVANGVLYLPVGALTVMLLHDLFGGRTRLLAVALAIAFGILLAFAVEFTQLYFPPRTVSQNDLIAECLGTLLGALVAPLLVPWAKRMIGAWLLGGRLLTRRLLEAYAASYFLLCFFPYDLLLSLAEWQGKMISDNCGWLLAPASVERGWVAGLLLLVEVVLALPFGALLAARRTEKSNTVGPAWVWGMALGLVIEVGQMAVASGISQGLSVLTRGVGVALGAQLWRVWASRGVGPLQMGLARYTWPLGLLYLPVLFAANGWFGHPVLGIDAVTGKWAALHLMPLYYHYFTTEAMALFSLGSVALMYLPMAGFAWARRWRPAAALLATAALSAVIEAGKLFLDGLHPDPTNTLIAVAACWAALHLAALMQRTESTQPTATATASVARPLRTTTAPTFERWLFTGPLLGFAAWSAWTWPVFAWLVLGVLTICAALVWRWPVLLLAVVPAALPIFDLAPWTGRFYWDEFDLLLLVLLSIGWHRTQPTAAVPDARGRVGLRVRLPSMLLTLLGVSLFISALRGLLPWQWPDLNAFGTYYSGFNALRISKGAVWACALAALYLRLSASDAAKQRTFAWGMSLGLLLTVGFVIWERLAFVGLLDFAADYRVTGPFSAMHTGGAYIECYLAVAIAYLMWLTMQTTRPLWRWLGAMLLLCSTYAMMVTYSRNGYLALLAVVLVMLGTAMIRPTPAREPTRKLRRVFVALLVGALMAAVAIPVLLGSFASQRVAQSGRDYTTRLLHWQDALQMRDSDWATTLFGVGVGRFPATHYWRSAEPVHAASYSLAEDKAGRWLRLGAGAPVYIEQIVDVKPGQRYRLWVDVRADVPSKLGVALCEKWMLTSGACNVTDIDANVSPMGWQHASATLTTESWQPHAWFRGPVVKLAFFHHGGANVVELTNIRFEAVNGPPLLANGNFSAGLDHWFFSTDADPPWHVHSLPVSIFFEQGWFGLLAGASAAAVAMGIAARRIWCGDTGAAPVLAALIAMMVSGVANTLVDAPRFLTLLLLLMWLGGHRRVQR